MTSRVVYCHEDFYRQIEILPARNLEFCQAELKQLGEFSDKHRAPGGMGWTDIYELKPAPIELAALALDFNQVCERLQGSLEPFARVETGYSSHLEACPGTRAFGIDWECVVFVEGEPGQIAQCIWLSLGGPGESRRSAILKAFENLGGLGELLLVDWGWSCLFPLSDVDGIRDYLKAREEHWQASGIADPGGGS